MKTSAIITRFAAALCVSLIVPAATTSAASAQETIKLQIISARPASSSSARMLSATLLPAIDRKVAKASGGKYKIAWTESYSGAVAGAGKTFSAIQSGTADIGQVDTLLHGAQLPLQQVTFHAPFTGVGPSQLLTIMTKVIDQMPEMRQAFLKYNQVLLAIGPVEEFVLVTKFPFRSIADLKGKKVCLPGPAAGWVKGTGAIAVALEASENHKALNSGSCEGAFISTSGMVASRLHEVASHVTQVGMGAMLGVAYTVNKERWDNLPRPVQDAIEGGFREYERRRAAAATAAMEAALKLASSRGAKVSTLPAEQRRRWAGTMPNIAKQWAADARKRGLPAGKVLEAYLRELRAVNADLARDWGK